MDLNIDIVQMKYILTMMKMHNWCIGCAAAISFKPH